MPKRKPTKPLSQADFPVYAETCADCGHSQAWHIGLVDAATLNGKMVPCRFDVTPEGVVERVTCGDTWKPTWKEGVG